MKIIKQSSIFKRAVFYPFIMAIFPVMSLYSYNVSQTPFSDTVRSFGLSLLTAAGMVVALRLVLRSWHRSGLVTTFVLLLFFSFGHIYQAGHSTPIGGVLLAQANILAAIWAALLIVGAWAIIRLLRKPEQWTPIINVITLTALALSFVNVLTFWIRNVNAASLNPPQPDKGIFPITEQVNPQDFPDIYYIILDGYARSDVLQEVYGIDNRDFLTFLKGKGFYVADASHSNYTTTALSIPSALNYDYLQNMVALDPASDSREPMRDLLNKSHIFQEMRTRGYNIVAFDTWFYVTRYTEADIFYPNHERLNPFETMLLTNSAAIFWIDRLASVERWENYRNSYELLYNTVDLPGPKFVFAHMIIPHPPFVFDQDGLMGSFMGTGEGDHFSGTREDYFAGYSSQVLYANKVFSRIVQHILETSDREPIIILQADHGPGAYLEWEHPENSCLKERHSILNAFFFPGKQTGALYPEISPVNTFRVMLNTVFGEDLPLLPDRTYFSSTSAPYDFQEITDQIEPNCAQEIEQYKNE